MGIEWIWHKNHLTQDSAFTAKREHSVHGISVPAEMLFGVFLSNLPLWHYLMLTFEDARTVTEKSRLSSCRIFPKYVHLLTLPFIFDLIQGLLSMSQQPSDVNLKESWSLSDATAWLIFAPPTSGLSSVLREQSQ